jgi:glycosyltransferase involved in cell wall biosynthesis
LERAYSRYFDELAGLAARERADLFIAHNLQALPAAAVAARRWHARLGFDAEDFHRGEFSPEAVAQSPLCRLTEMVEEKYIPQCGHLTAASDGIGANYAAALGVCQPVTVLNVFPLSEREGRTPRAELQRERPGAGLSLYWYSQVIGGDRGLDDVLQTMALLGDGVHLCLRGTWADGYERIFRERTQTLGVEKQIHILPPALPEQLVERAAQHDVGLALEPAITQNRRIAVSNKILNYFLAGLAIAATDVPGQRGIMERAPGAGFLFAPGDAETLAARLRDWSINPVKLQSAKAASIRAGKNRFCWDIEKQKLLEAVAQALKS